MKPYSTLCLAVFVATFLSTGCQKGTESPEAAPAARNSKEARIAEAMAKLSEADRALAMSQKTCPVSDAPLGTMGAPVKVNVQGRDVFICCGGCRELLEEEADKYLAKLPAQAAP
jgi:hypothetical protein